MQKVKTTKLLLILSIIFFWFAQYVYMPLQTPYLFSLGAAASLVGVVVGAYGLTQMLLRIPIGIAADKYSRHKIFILAGVIFSAIASIFRVFFATPTAFLVANMLSGTASAMWISFTVFFSSLFNENELKKSMGYVIGANNIGILLSFVAGSLINDLWGIQYVFISSILSGILATLLAVFIREPKPDTAVVVEIHPLTVFKSRPLILYSLLGIGMQAIIPATALSFTMSYMKQLTDQELLLGVSSFIFIAFSALSSLAIGNLHKGSNNRIISMLFGCLAIYCIFVPLTTAVWQLCILQAIAGIGNGGLMSLLMTCVLLGIPKHNKSTAMGFFQSVYGLGMTLGPILLGALVGSSGYLTGYWVLALIALISLVAVLLMPRASSLHRPPK